ncbi:hypothetical protein ACWD4O_46465 [Streptomyces sp. NPDC002623]
MDAGGRADAIRHDLPEMGAPGDSAQRADGVEGETCLLGAQDDGDAGEVDGGMATVACSTGAVTRERTAGWIAGQRKRAEADRLFLALPMFMAAATAPASLTDRPGAVRWSVRVRTSWGTLTMR